MRLETKKLLYDILRAAESLERFASGKNFAEYEADPMLRAAVERQFEIIGEALRQLRRRILRSWCEFASTNVSSRSATS